MVNVSIMYAVPSRLLNNVVFALLAVVCGSLAFFFGGNFPLAQALMPIICALLLMLSVSLPPQTLAGASGRWLLAGVFLPVLAVLVWSAVQILPLSPQSPWANAFFKLVDDTSPWVTISLNPGTTLLHLAYASGLAALGWVAFRLGQGAPKPVLTIIAVIITLACAYGILTFAMGNGYVLWLPKTSYLNSLTSTFINRNSFATFAGLGVLSCLALALHRVGEISSRLSTRQRLSAFILLVVRPGWPWFVASFICFLALVLTNSRAGVTASLCGVIVLLGSLAGMRAAVRLPLAGIILAILVGSGIILAAVGSALGDRLERVSEDSDIRSAIYNQSGTLIDLYPLTGSGLGTYQQAFSTVRTPSLFSSLNLTVEHAHNTYIELLTELGYPAAMLLALSAFCLLVTLINGLRVRRRAVIWPALGLASVVLVGGHALVDFSLSIPAVATASIVILMLALSQSLQVAEGDVSINKYKKHLTHILLPLSGLLLALSVWQSFSEIKAYRASRTLNSIQASLPVKASQLYDAQKNLQSCLSINPAHPTCAFGLAQTNLSLATGYGLTGPRSGISLVFLNISRAQYQSALSRNPSNPAAWYRLARINAYLGNRPAALESLTNSILTAPAEPKLAYLRIPLMLSLLPDASPDDANVFTNNIKSLWQSAPWSVGNEMRNHPITHPALAKVLAAEPDLAPNWHRFFGTRFPNAETAPTPLEPAPKTR